MTKKQDPHIIFASDLKKQKINIICTKTYKCDIQNCTNYLVNEIVVCEQYAYKWRSQK